MIPVSHPKTAAEILANAAAVRKRIMSMPSKPRKSPEPVDQPVTRIYMTAPKERVWTRQHDSHMAAYYEWKGNEPLGFLKLRCRELDVSYEVIESEAKPRWLVKIRDQIIVDVKTRFPGLPLGRIGKMIGGRDHTSILNSLRKHGISTALVTMEDRADEFKALFDEGYGCKVIASKLGYSHQAVAILIKRQAWSR